MVKKIYTYMSKIDRSRRRAAVLKSLQTNSVADVARRFNLTTARVRQIAAEASGASDCIVKHGKK